MPWNLFALALDNAKAQPVTDGVCPLHMASPSTSFADITALLLGKSLRPMVGRQMDRERRHIGGATLVGGIFSKREVAWVMKRTRQAR
jgi:hypothetical protein